MSAPNSISADEVIGNWQALSERGPVGPILRAEDLQLWTEGKGYLAETKQVLDQAHQYVESLAAAERARGYSEGWEAGSKDLFEFMAQTKVAVDAYYAQLEANLRELAIQIIREVVDDLDASDAVAFAARKALKTPSLGAEVTLYVAPEVFPEIREKLEGHLNEAAASVITLRDDPKLSPRGCKLVSDFCTIDVSIDKQLALLADSLRASNVGVRA